MFGERLSGISYNIVRVETLLATPGGNLPTRPSLRIEINQLRLQSGYLQKV